MITEQKIRKMAGTRAYSRGERIFNQNWKIEEFSVEKDGDTDFIEAQVTGSYGNSYEVTAVYDTELETVKEISCECPAFAEYSGICKHCVAVLLEYQDYCHRQKILSDFAASTGKRSLERFFPGRYDTREGTKSAPVKIRRTDKAVQDLLEQNQRVREARAKQTGLSGTVELVPELALAGKEIYLSMKIGERQKYVVKDLMELADDLRECRYHSYGKKLAFVHEMDAFTEESKSAARYIMDWAEEKQEDSGPSYGYYSYGYGISQEKYRQIVMGGYELERFLQTFQGTSVTVLANGSEKKWKINREELPKNILTVTGEEEGAELKLAQMKMYAGREYRICFFREEIFLIPRHRGSFFDRLLESLYKKTDRTVFVGKEDLPAFCRGVFPEKELPVPVKMKNFAPEEYVLPAVSFEIYLDMPQQLFITCRIMAVYGETKYNVMDEKEDAGKRDVIREKSVKEAVSGWFNAYDPESKQYALAEDEEKIVRFIIDGIAALQNLGTVFISEKLKKVKLRKAQNVSAGASLSGDLLELKMSVDDISPDELAEILSAYHQKRKYYRLKDGEILDIRDERIRELAELTRELGLKEKEIRQQEIELPGYRALYLDERMKESRHLEIEENEEFTERIRMMADGAEERIKEQLQIPETIENILRDYQKTGVYWIGKLKAGGFGGILADDMGLGKTLQVIAFLAAEREKNASSGSGNGTGRTLIITPASLVYNWQSEIEQFAPWLPVRMIAGTAVQREEMIRSLAKSSPAGDSPAGNSPEKSEILLTSYDLLKRDIRFYEGISFENQIVDEAQYIKNHGTQAAKAVRKIHSKFRLALTGTPVENRLSELWSIFAYLMPGLFGTYQSFHKELELPALRREEEASERIRRMIRPFILRRLKKDVLKDLPDKIEKDTFARLEPEQQKLYDAHVKRLQLFLDGQNEEEFRTSKIEVLAELTKLRQLCCYPGLLYEDYKPMSAKENLCMDLINSAVESGHKVLLFSQFTTMLEQLCRRLDQEKIGYYLLTGATSKEKRKEMVHAFQEDDTPVFCISLKAGGTGLNLTAADIVIHYDPWWNVAVQDQATDRVHRIGQKNVVTVYRLIAKGTVEENIIRLQDRKRQLADSVLGGEGMDSGSFTKEELLELLRL